MIVYMRCKDIWNYMSEDTYMTLFPNRYKRAESYIFESDRLRCISVGVLLYKVLGLTEKDIDLNTFGKPFSIKGPQFSVSHSGEYVVLACSSTEVGVDVEKIEEKYLDLMPQVFTKDEISYVGNNLEYFYRIWTLKESLSKAVGEGLNMPLDEVSVSGLLTGESILYKGKKWYGFTSTFGANAYILSVVKNENIAITIRELE